ncbi:hypothetical protein TRVA0_002S03114 [Trichomonascus vanleenenianus]|uniref:THO complex subunit 7 family protein n=1 Tax=Trichomonascus vanleenenianus TaxID=2268995 RepID=UPI003ECA0008
MDEESIIRDRVATSEIAYKRILKVCQTASQENGAKEELVGQIESEFRNFEVMLEKLQLQLDMNGREMEYYESEKQQSERQIEALLSKTNVLQEQLEQAQKVRHQKEEYSNFVDSMMRAKKVFVTEGDTKVPIIALLNCSRSDDMRENETTAEEIESLEQQRTALMEQWTERKSKFGSIIKSIHEFRDEVLGLNQEEDNGDQQEDEDNGDREGDDHETGDDTEMEAAETKTVDEDGDEVMR